MEYQIKKCPFCAEAINVDAIKCKHCGEILDADIRSARASQSAVIMQPQRKWSPGVAALLSFVLPGAGQIYKNEIGTGIIWMIVVIIGYFLFIIPGLILHLICIITAANGDPYK